VIQTSEKETQRAILDFLAIKGIFAWRNNTGAVSIQQGGKRRYVRYGAKGSPDILGILPFSGKLLAIECKSSRGKLSQDQKVFLKAIHDAAGEVIVARSVDDVISRFNELRI